MTKITVYGRPMMTGQRNDIYGDDAVKFASYKKGEWFRVKSAPQNLIYKWIFTNYDDKKTIEVSNAVGDLDSTKEYLMEYAKSEKYKDVDGEDVYYTTMITFTPVEQRLAFLMANQRLDKEREDGKNPQSNPNQTGLDGVALNNAITSRDVHNKISSFLHGSGKRKTRKRRKTSSKKHCKKPKNIDVVR